jgi:hypothetical protein
MNLANTNWRKYMMRNPREKMLVSQQTHLQAGDTHKHTFSYFYLRASFIDILPALKGEDS